MLIDIDFIYNLQQHYISLINIVNVFFLHIYYILHDTVGIRLFP